jgi:hypothetical protein
MADAEDLKSSGDFSSCGFDSHPGHQVYFKNYRVIEAAQSAVMVASSRRTSKSVLPDFFGT